jgi:hypothetical protein
MSGIYKEVIVSTGEYQTPDGQTKQRWAKCGIVIQKPNGSLSMKLDLFPQWFMLADPRPKEDRPKPPARTVSRGDPFADLDDDIPNF